MAKRLQSNRKTAKDKNADLFREEYAKKSSDAERLIGFIKEQIHTAVNQNAIALGFPISSRVKSLYSIAEKVERKKKYIKSVTDLDDFAGIRIVLLFKKDIVDIESFIKSTFIVISAENTASRLGDSSFGYQSNHYIVKLRPEWASIPSLSDLAELKVEVQLRTIAQHMWAAISHKLQYKAESAVPIEIRRAINRSSAILELVDLEFDRVIIERQNYLDKINNATQDSDTELNVDLLKEILNRKMPGRGTDNADGYAKLLAELESMGVINIEKLEKLISERFEEALAEDKTYLDDGNNKEHTSTDIWNRGYYFSHIGMIRNMLRYEFGEKADEIIG